MGFCLKLIAIVCIACLVIIFLGCLPDEILKLGIEVFNKLFVELNFAQRARPLILTPGKDALTMEVVSHIAWQNRDHLLTSTCLLKTLNADSTLRAPLKNSRIVPTLIQSQQAQRLFVHNRLIVLW